MASPIRWNQKEVRFVSFKANLMILATFLAAAVWFGALAPTPTPLPIATLPPRSASPAPVPSATPARSSLTNDQASKIDQIALDALHEQAVAGISLAVV